MVPSSVYPIDDSPGIPWKSGESIVTMSRKSANVEVPPLSPPASVNVESAETRNVPNIDSPNLLASSVRLDVVYVLLETIGPTGSGKPWTSPKAPHPVGGSKQ